jgi:hypothetical protein
MAENGISLGSATVSADTSQQQGGFERQECNGYRYRSPLSRIYSFT